MLASNQVIDISHRLFEPVITELRAFLNVKELKYIPVPFGEPEDSKVNEVYRIEFSQAFVENFQVRYEFDILMIQHAALGKHKFAMTFVTRPGDTQQMVIFERVVNQI